MKRQTLIQLKQGAKGRVNGFLGGQVLVNRLNDLGIRPGKEFVKVSNSFFGGPVTIKIDNNKIAIGKGMAAKIMVDVDDL